MAIFIDKLESVIVLDNLLPGIESRLSVLQDRIREDLEINRSGSIET
jgi:hypothetical protein